MALSAAERQVRYRLKQYAQRDTLPKTQCACGCGELIAPINRLGKPATYKHGHNPDGIPTRFVQGQICVNKGKRGLFAVSHPHKGKHLMKESLQKRTATRLANNGGFYSVISGWKHKPLTIALMTKVNQEKALCGEDNPAWLGGKSFEEYGKEFNDSLKYSILERDGWRCVDCGISAKTTCLAVHHKDTNKKNNTPTNLQTLCKSCHGRLHGKILQNIRVERKVM